MGQYPSPSFVGAAQRCTVWGAEGSLKVVVPHKSISEQSNGRVGVRRLGPKPASHPSTGAPG